MIIEKRVMAPNHIPEFPGERTEAVQQGAEFQSPLTSLFVLLYSNKNNNERFKSSRV